MLPYFTLHLSSPRFCVKQSLIKIGLLCACPFIYSSFFVCPSWLKFPIFSKPLLHGCFGVVQLLTTYPSCQLLLFGTMQLTIFSTREFRDYRADMQLTAFYCRIHMLGKPQKPLQIHTCRWGVDLDSVGLQMLGSNPIRCQVFCWTNQRELACLLRNP